LLLKDAIAIIQERHREAAETNNQQMIHACLLDYKNLLGSSPDDLALLFFTGTCELQLGFNGPAINYFRRCLEIAPETPEIWNNLGSAYKAENLDEKALECWQEALKIREDADYYNNMVTLYINTGSPEKGMEWAEKGLALKPDMARLRWNYSLLLLEQGRWKEGFAEYEYGKASLDRPERNYTNDGDLPWWNGEPGNVVVYGEQGMGDEVMFASCIPDAMEKADIVFDCHPRMIDIWKRSFGIDCFPTRKGQDVSWARDYRFDYRCAIGDLFRIFRSDGNFPKTPYLKPDPELVKHYRAKLEATGPGPYIGISWLAGTKSTRTDFRSIKLGHIKELFEVGGTFISLQYTEGAEGKVERFKNDTGYEIHHWKDVVEANTGEMDEQGQSVRATGFNYDHTVALISALDLCILPNTTAVHVCGALGKECWTLTPKEAAWRYQLKGNEMPMYKSVTQFRDGIEQVIEAYRERYHSGSWSESVGVATG
jgi:tetratricopeptide (TPR) repeat protein